MVDDYEDPLPGKTYVSPSLKQFGEGDRRIRIATKRLDSETEYAFAKIRNELVLRHTEGGGKKITAKFLEDDRRLFVLSIQAYTPETGNPHSTSFSFIGDEIDALLAFVADIRSVEFQNDRAMKITDEELRRLVLSRPQARQLVGENEELFAEAVSSLVTKMDVVAIAYRKKQLEVFRSLLEDKEYFEKIKERKGCRGNEALWQRFFEANPWIFGYGLSYVYLDSLDDKKLEQVVQGFSVAEHGKRTDALMKSKGVISSLCFVEIKTHRTALLDARPYRAGCWPTSDELSGAVSQVQGTVAAAMDNIRGKLSLTDCLGNPTGEEAFNYSPKAFLVIGNLSEFVGEHGVNKDQLRSFELFRRNIISPEIITFDELFERAKFIVSHTVSSS